MNIRLRNFDKIQRDNDTNYLLMLEGILNSVDELCEVEVNRRSESIGIRIAPSHPSYLKDIIRVVKDFHYSIGFRIEFSKSIKTSSSLDFQINLSESN
jgi:hypothetical protein